MSKKNASRLTGAGKSGDRGTKILSCLDEAGTQRRALGTLAGLLAHCGEAEHIPMPPSMVGETGGLMLAELKKLEASLARLATLTLDRK